MDERSERASAASEASGAFRTFGEALRSKTFPRGFLQEERTSATTEASGALKSLGEALRSKTVPRGFIRETKQTGCNQKNKRRFPFHVKSGFYVGGGFANQDVPKKWEIHWFYKVSGYLSKLMLNSSSRGFQDGPRGAQDASKTPQEAPKTPPRGLQERPRRP